MTKYPFHVSKLPSGLQVVTAEMPHMESVAIGVWACVGGRYEPAELSGISHFIEHMNFKGTPRRSGRRISQAIESIGGLINGFTGEEATCYYVKVRYPKFKNALDVILDLYFHSKFDPVEIDRERDVIKEEIRMYADAPQQLVYEDFNATIWRNHPLGRSLLGTFSTIDTLAWPELNYFRNMYYTPANTIISVAGNTRQEMVAQLVAKHTEELQLPAAAIPDYKPFRSVQRAPRIHLRCKDAEQAHAILGFRAFGRNDPRRFQLRLLSTILGENMSSRLNHEIREKRGIAYAVHSHVTRYQETGTLQISIATEPGKLIAAFEHIMRICRAIAEKGITATELRHAREFVRGNVGLALERTTDHMIWLGESLLTSGTILTIEEIIAGYDQVTRDDISTIARQIFTPRTVNLAVISPDSHRRTLEKNLKTIVSQ